MKFARPYLIFLNPIYWVITTLRNIFYDIGLLKSTYFNHPILVIGNLSTGGTGKTPHTEYVIELLKETENPAVLSRGYRRKTTGFVISTKASSAEEIGDEPAQIKQKFPDITVAVDADRVHGVGKLLDLPKQPSAIILDDAFQHRRLQAGFYVLLTPINQLYADDYLLPAGNLRESRTGADRAHCIVVTKCPKNISEVEKARIKAKLKPKSHQHVFFTAIDYGKISGDEHVSLQKPFLLVTGIANAKPLVDYLKSQQKEFEHLNFGDHHHFTDTEIADIIKRAKQLESPAILTTEKDYQRLPLKALREAGVALAYLPIKVKFLANQVEFNNLIEDYIAGYKA